MFKLRLLFLGLLLAVTLQQAEAQTYTEAGNTYPIAVDGNKYVVSGFTQFNNLTDEQIYANALLWAVENLCPQLREGITEVAIPTKKFDCEFTLGSLAGSGQENLYHLKATFRVADRKLVYYLSDIRIESGSILTKKITPMEKLNPEKKPSHKETMDNFVQSESLMLNKLFDTVAANQASPITHWNEIQYRRAVAGMTEDECRIAFGKPQSVMETNGEIQWMYSSSFYIFFKNGRVTTIIK